jgi:hypothetical protein
VLVGAAQARGAGVLHLVSTSRDERWHVSQANLTMPLSSFGANSVTRDVFGFDAQSGSTLVTSTLPPMRLTPGDVRANQNGSEQIGSSGLAGVSTKILFGDPSKRGFYTIVLFVPAHTTIPAHSHRDDRMAAVVSGIWQFGYGDHFDEGALKNLPVGSVYSEPGRMNHFARTGADPVLVEISGFGPTDTVYVNPADAPKTQRP